MTTRKTLFIDRVATLVLSLVLIAGGAAATWWWTGRSPLPGTTDVTSVHNVVTAGWWPWVSAVAGVVLILVGIRWIAAHLQSQRVSRLLLTGSGTGGRLDTSASRVAAAAADAFADTLGVRSAKGAIVRDRGQLVAHVSAVIEAEADLRLVAERADLVSAQLARVLDRGDLRCSVELRVAQRSRALPRVN